MVTKRLLMLIAVILLLATVTPVSGKNMPTVKTSLNLGASNGATFGVRVGGNEHSGSERYINASYMFASVDDYTTYAGANYEWLQLMRDRKTYFFFNCGLDWGKLGDMGFDATDESDEQEYTNFVIPHLVFGLGYRFVKGKSNTAFIEWDFGIKAALTNINLGVTF